MRVDPVTPPCQAPRWQRLLFILAAFLPALAAAHLPPPARFNNPLATANPALANSFNKDKTRAQLEATSVFAETAMRIVGDVYQRYDRDVVKAREALRQAEVSRDATQIAQADTQLKAAEAARRAIETERALAHGLVGALTAAIGGASPVNGFIGGTAGKLATTELDKLLASSAWAQKNPVATNLLKTLSATAVGSITGGTTGGFVASNGDRFNRQLHESERLRIKKLAKGDAQKEARLTAAACALVKCYAEYPTDSLAYAELKKLADIGDLLSVEKSLLANQTYGGEKLFGYSTTGFNNDKFKDSVKRIDNTYQIATRTLGVVQTAGGAAMLAGAVAAAPTCVTGVACFGVAGAGTLGVDSIYTGYKQALNGDPQATMLNNALQSLGLSPQAAGIVELTLGIGSAATAANSLSKATVIAQNPLAAASYQEFVTNGLNVTDDIMATPQAQKLVQEIMAGRPTLSLKEAEFAAREFLKSGTQFAQQQTLSSNTVLYKVVPKGEAFGKKSQEWLATTGYWLTQQQASQIARMTPQQAANVLGLPLAQTARMMEKGMDFLAIAPKPGATPTVFVSDIAPATQAGINIGGGAKQVIVPNRTRWSDPVRVNPARVGVM